MSDLTAFARERQKQREEAAQISAQRRRQRRVLVEKIRDGEIDGIDLLAGRIPELEPFIAPWKAERAVRAVKGIGPVAAQRVLEAWRGSPIKRLRDMTPEDREALSVLCDQIVNPWKYVG